MTIGDLIFYILDAVILYMLYRMWQNSRRVQVRTSLGPRWVIPGMFWAIAALGFFNYTGAFRWIQTLMLVGMGAIYWQMDSGLAPKGVVMFGRLYPYEKCMPISVDEETHCVNFTIRKAPTPVYFLPEQMKEVRSYLSRHAGVAKKTVRPTSKSTAIAEKPGKESSPKDTRKTAGKEKAPRRSSGPTAGKTTEEKS